MGLLQKMNTLQLFPLRIRLINWAKPLKFNKSFYNTGKYRNHRAVFLSGFKLQILAS